MLLVRHPLENPSLAPLGLRTKLSHQRLLYKPTVAFSVFEERMMARFWEKRNRADAPRPLPVETILHRILPSMAQSNRIVSGDFIFEGKPYLTRDLMTLSRTVQWLGTNIGRSFVDEPMRGSDKHHHQSREFVLKLAKENKRHNMYAFLSHRCTPMCGNSGRQRLPRPFVSCVFVPHSVTERDKAVIDGLMRWLGMAEGRQYMADYRARRSQAYHEANERRRRYYQRRQRLKAA